MKRKIIALLAAVLLTAALPPAALASGRVPELSVDVVLRTDGSAYITQIFSAVTDEGTEFYLDYLVDGALYITGLRVSDENGPYEVLPEGTWDVDASFEEKARKCGLLPIDGGTELCWGITEYGEHRYAVEYVLHGLVGRYDDADGFLYRFVNAGLSFFPTNVTLTIRAQDGLALTDADCGIWAFGFDGEIQFEDGIVRARTRSALEGEQNVTVMLSLPRGMLSPERTEDGSFESVKERAFAGSDYDDDEVSFLSVILFLLCAAAAVLGLIFLWNGIQAAKRKKLMARAEYFRDAPNGGDLNASFALGSALGFCPEDSLLGARLLRLIALGSLEPVNGAQAGGEVSLRPTREPHGGDAFDEALYTFLQTAAGPDGVLQPKELEAFCADGRHGETLAKFLDECERSGRGALVRKGCFRGAVCESMKDLTATGRKELDELVGLKRYLMDFSLLPERNVTETFLWQEYMVYAMLLGIAKEVIRQLEAHAAGPLPELERYSRYVGWAYSYDAVLCTAANRERARLRQARSGGGGGVSSLGGGSGFLGGGGGGIR